MTWVFRTAEGRITKTLEGGRDTAEENLGPDETLVWVDAPVRPSSHYMRGEEPVAYPPRPGPWAEFDYAAGVWFDPRTPEQVAADDLAAHRATIPREVSVMQAMIVVGEERWSQAMGIADDPSYPWAMRAAIRGATMLVRDSETMDTLGFLLGFSPEEIDQLFIVASQVSV
ncbi:hypothetical protein Rsph17029_0629 [Rhodobacter sphaeroides ATCC 17029]|jgi:hypothetical protein|nr:hypothetical protein Rsph17029_0629 [Cereibacter sphaeroides ATCC 17029]